jgi:putative redox protein
MSFTGSADSGFEIPLDAKTTVGGSGNGFLPLELMAVSLAGCTAMDVISILKKMKQEVTDFIVEVKAKRADQHPKVFTEAVIKYSVTGTNVVEKSLSRAIELSAVRYCPAQSMLTKSFPMQLVYEINQVNEAGETVATITGDVSTS